MLYVKLVGTDYYIEYLGIWPLGSCVPRSEPSDM